MFSRASLWCLWLAVFAALVGCAKKHQAEYAYAEESYAYDGDDYGAVVMESSKSSSRSRSSAPAAPPPPPAEAMMMMDAAEPMPEPEAQAAPTPASQRMVHYNGYAQVRVARLPEGVDAVKAIADGAGGFVERIGTDHVVIRVPVATFDDTMDKVLALGEVLSKSITADDVTESFAAVTLRLDTAKATRERLVALLAKTTDENEKLRLLREIQRLTDSIDQMESQARTLSQLASMSRITVALVPREALAHQGPEDDPAELAWIRSLSPFRSDVLVESKKLGLDVPEGMVALDVKKRFIAESADGARIWSHKLDNAPQGDADFWLGAVQERLAEDFASADVVQLGRYKALRLVDRSDDPYVWVIAVAVSGNKLEVVQIYYASAEQESRYQDAVTAVLGGGAA